MWNQQKMNPNQKLLILAKMLTVIIVSSILTFSVSVLVLQIFLGFITIYFSINSDYKSAKLWSNIFLVSMFFSFLVFLGNNIYFGEPYFIGGSDDLMFEEWGRTIYNFGIYSPSKIIEYNIIGIFNNSVFFTVYIARLIQFANIFGGYTTFLPRVANVHFFIWICMIIKYLLTRHTKISQKNIYYSVAVFAFMPSIQYINSHVFRDTFNFLQVLLIGLLFDLALRKKHIVRFASLILIPIIAYSAYYTRASSILFAGILVVFIISSRYKIRIRYIIPIVLPLMFLSDILAVFKVGQFIEVYSNYLLGSSDGGLSSVVFSQPLLPFGILFRTIYAFVSPFPDLFLFKEPSRILLDLIQLAKNIGVFLQIIFIPFVIKRALKLDWIALIFLSWFLPIIASTFTFRHFLFFYPFMSALAIDGYMNTNKRARKNILYSSIFIVICLSLVYVSLKLL